MTKIKQRVLINKRNNQLSITLPKNSLKYLKGKEPKFLRLRVKKEDFIW